MASLLDLFPDTVTISAQGVLQIAGYSLVELAETYGTPLYIFDYATIYNTCISYWQALRTHYHASNVRLLYAAKAYLSPLLASSLAELGMGLDVVSGGELLVARRANLPMEHVSFHGNNKSALVRPSCSSRQVRYGSWSAARHMMIYWHGISREETL